MNPEQLTIALPKGKLLGPTLQMLDHLELPTQGVSDGKRSLVFDFPDHKVSYIMCRPTDVPTYVEHGAADLGIVGKDIILDQAKDVYEMVDLGFGYCRFIVAVPRDKVDHPLAAFNYQRVATKFTHVAEEFFREQGLQVEVIKLHGNIELAPRVGLAEIIVDIVSTGKTLEENFLKEKANIAVCTARVIVNRVSYRTKYSIIEPMISKISRLAEEGVVKE
ncbi:MAG: ATP phosphoribosyltransferase [Syntrophomonadaceae bacterium]|nr:ATP phosphoribosyltransferase [Syntrophomonadaceae bacterium]